MTKRNWYKHFDVVYRKYCLYYKLLKHDYFIIFLSIVDEFPYVLYFSYELHPVRPLTGVPGSI